MSFVDTNTDDWSNYIGPNGVPRIDVTPKQQLKEYEDLKYYADKLPVQGQVAPTTYIMEPDLVETQTGKVHTPPDVSFDDAGFAYNNVTGEPVQIIRRPDVLPVARTPDGFTFAMPKMLDVVGNVMSPLIAGKVPVKAGEVVLGSGAVRTMNEAEKPLTIYRGEYSGNKGGRFWSTDFDFAKQFTQSGQDHEVLKRTIKPSEILKADHVYAGNADEVDKVLEQAKKGGFKAVELNEGQGQPNSIMFLSDTRPQVTNAVGHAIEKQTGPFYSSLERAVDNAKLSKADASQWLGYLKNQPGVKSEELAYVLKELPEGPITKEVLADIVKSNKIELKEVVKGELKPQPSKYNIPEVRRAVAEAGDTPGDLELTLANDGNAYRALMSRFPELKDNEDWAEIVAKSVYGGDSKPIDTTKYHDYQLPGGENYQEMLLTLPQKDKSYFEAWKDWIKENNLGYKPVGEQEYLFQQATGRKPNDVADYKSSHWDEPNILAHVRYNDRDIPDVGKSLHLEEIQSDWHQAGRKQGYKDPKVEAAINRLKNETYTPEDLELIQTAGVTDTKNYQGVPDAPFKKNWDELAFKRMLHKAATEGYDSISWTPGEAQALRYQNDVRQKLNSVDWHNKSRGKINSDGKKQILVTPVNGSEIELTVDKAGKIISGHAELKNKNLDSVLGKDITRQILEKEEGNIDAKGYVMNSEGMKSFYDKMLVDKANALTKKYGAKVETKNIKAAPVYETKNPILNKNGEEVVSVYKDGVFLADMKKSEAASYIASRKEKDAPTKIHVLKLTPELKAKAKEGFPLFSSTPITTPVDYDPFQTNQKYKLVPIEGDPFK